MEGNLIVLKKLEHCPTERNSDRTKLARRNFADWLLNHAVNREELVFIDEAGINLYMARTRGRARRGQRAVRVVAGRRETNLTVCLAVSNTRGLVHHTFRQGGMNGESFVDFLQDLSVRCAPDSAFIFDNAPAHRRAGGVNGPRLQDEQSVHYLPPYSPMLNIVENAISCFKATLKRSLEEARPAMLQMEHDERMVQLTGMAELSFDAIEPQMGGNLFQLVVPIFT